MILQMSNEAYVMLFIGFLVVTVLLLLFLVFRVRKTRQKFKDEKAIVLEGLLTRATLISSINVYLSKNVSDIFFSLLYIEITNFVDISNAFGKRDSLLALEKLAYQMSFILPKRAQMANYKTTDFLVFLKSEYDRFQCLELAKALVNVIKKPIKIYHDTTVHFSGNIGVSFHPAHGRSFNRLENSLRLALDNSKAQGSNNYAVYSSTMAGQSGGDVEHHYDIKKAMDNKEFVLHYQPIINIRDNVFYGAEALVRWNHPKHGVLTPAQFINTMEQTGDIVWIGTWGIEALTKQYLALKLQFPENEFLFNLNLSPKQLMEEKLVKEFVGIIRKYNLAPSFICLEISDFSIIEKNQTIKKTLNNLKKVGFRIAINGYGLDPAAFSVLGKTPIDIIKLGRNFFDKEFPINRRIADLIIEFSKNQGILVIAEEIENDVMYAIAQEMGVTHVQGFYFSKPIMAEDLQEYIAGKRWNEDEGNDIFCL